MLSRSSDDRSTSVSLIGPRCVAMHRSTGYRIGRPSESLGAKSLVGRFKAHRAAATKCRESKSLVNPTVITGKFNRINGRVSPVRRVSYRPAAAGDTRLDFVTRYCVVGHDIGSGSNTSKSRSGRNNSRAIFDIADLSDRRNSVAMNCEE